MQLFNEDSLKELLLKCYQNEGYHAGIMFNTQQNANDFITEMNQVFETEGINGVSFIGLRVNRPVITFENGSYIEAFSTETNIRGRSYHEGLLDTDVMDGFAMIAFQSQIREYEAPVSIRRKWERESGRWGTTKKPDDDIKVDKKSKKILDDFLDSFKINNSLEFGA